MLKPSNYKHIIWDWNGTLINDAWLFVDVINKILKENDMNIINVKKYKKIFGFPIKNYYEKLGFDLTTKSFEKLGLQFIEEYKKRLFDAQLYPMTENVLLKLSSLKIKHHILSASHQKILNSQIKHYKIKKYFSNVMGINNYYANNKIKEGIKLMEKLNVNEKDVLFIGDTKHDHEVANMLNVDCLLISHGHHSYSRLLKTNKMTILNFNDLII